MGDAAEEVDVVVECGGFGADEFLWWWCDGLPGVLSGGCCLCFYMGC